MKDLVPILRWAENPRDRLAGFRTLQLLPGIGPAHAGRALDRMAEAEVAFDALADAKPPAAAAAALAGSPGADERSARAWPSLAG